MLMPQKENEMEMLNYTFGNALDDGDPCCPVEDGRIRVAILDIEIP
jgi:hypothetical protein